MASVLVLRHWLKFTGPARGSDGWLGTECGEPGPRQVAPRTALVQPAGERAVVECLAERIGAKRGDPLAPARHERLPEIVPTRETVLSTLRFEQQHAPGDFRLDPLQKHDHARKERHP